MSEKQRNRDKERTLAYCTKSGVRDKFADHTTQVGVMLTPSEFYGNRAANPQSGE